MRARRTLLWLLIGISLALAACSDGGASSSSSQESGNWDELQWDEGNWQ
jgi:hypothetical protein